MTLHVSHQRITNDHSHALMTLKQMIMHGGHKPAGDCCPDDATMFLELVDVMQ